MTPNEEALVADLCRMIVESEDYANAQWEATAVVCDVHEHGSTNVHGYSFTTDTSADRLYEPCAPDATKVFFDTLRALNATMLERTGTKWKTCLVQIVRDGMKFSIDFEYDREDRWFPSSDDPAFWEFPMSINPLLAVGSNLE